MGGVTPAFLAEGGGGKGRKKAYVNTLEEKDRKDSENNDRGQTISIPSMPPYHFPLMLGIRL